MPDYVESWGPTGVGLRVEFLQERDRIGHAIKRIEKSPSETGASCLTSVEGLSSDLWPSSPPLQSVHLEERGPGSRIALLVGLAGKSHWSLSVEPVVGEAAIRFDVACRANAEPAWLGSTYEQPQSLSLVTFETTDEILRQDSIVRICPQLDAENPKLPRTIRWTYVVRLISAQECS